MPHGGVRPRRFGLGPGELERRGFGFQGVPGAGGVQLVHLLEPRHADRSEEAVELLAANRVGAAE